MPWSFRGTSFERILSGGDEPQWFPQQVATTVDAVAGDVGASPRRYVDLGGREVEPLQLQVAVTTEAARATLRAAVGLSGTLTSPAGYSGTALLTRADPLARLGGSYYRLRLVFEYVQ